MDFLEEDILKNEAYIKSETLTHDLVLWMIYKKVHEIEFDEIKQMILISK
jgi:isoleucyl-tRNA synthetase